MSVREILYFEGKRLVQTFDIAGSLELATCITNVPSKPKSLIRWSAQTNRNLPTIGKVFSIAALAAVCSIPSWSVLGEDVSSVPADQVHSNASVRVTPGQNFTVHELRSPSGVVVQEYASAAGKIFAVSWQGPTLPDMKQLLGSYFEEFQKAAQENNQPGGHSPLIVHHPGLVVELGGHMRAFAGRAYLADQMPSEVRSEEIR